MRAVLVTMAIGLVMAGCAGVDSGLSVKEAKARMARTSCTLNTPGPLLERTAGTGYRLSMDTDSSTLETLDVGGGTRLKATSYGCEDNWGLDIEATGTQPDKAPRTTAEALAWLKAVSSPAWIPEDREEGSAAAPQPHIFVSDAFKDVAKYVGNHPTPLKATTTEVEQCLMYGKGFESDHDCYYSMRLKIERQGGQLKVGLSYNSWVN